MSIKKQVDVLVIGAGPSGTIAASIMHQKGLDVQIVEKQLFPRFVIGESLLPRCMEALEEAKFLDAVKAKKFQQKDGAKFVMGDQVCDFNFNQQFTPGWNWTWQVPRSEFDKVLADECEKMGIPLHYETEVTDIKIFDDHSITTVVKDGKEETIQAKFIVDGSGYGRVIPRLFGLDKPSTQSPRKTVFCHMTDPKRSEAVEPNRITVFVHDPKTWIWVIPFSNGNTSVGYVGDPEFFEKFPGDIKEQFRALLNAQPELAVRFDESEMVWGEPRSLQSWSATTSTFYGKGFVLTGNVTEFLDPVFSSGVTLASVSAQLAANMVVRQLNGEQPDWENDYMKKMMTGVDVFRTYVNGWYDGTLFNIFFAENRNPEIMSQICSVLAGYVWDESNPFVKNHEKNIRTLSRYLTATKTSM
ncbi:NAD(P)/FAD-dependent oxidoreductase [Polluticoccus soli]|uniref:NAD(P)/FAD-dependent oxidoreductase n=1 Tax=Polluticoccus soli TaxID=3034150 RepID=UPI0023E19C9E|nr:FAD-dependent oxidoreductase [Flavipsychrobacter sp. JY13-12]